MKNLYTKRLFAGLLVMLLLAAVGTVNAQTKIYIAEGGTGNGSSWLNAAGSIQDAIQSASEGTEIWIKSGTYYVPGDSMFVLKRGVSLYGGFEGMETDPNQRTDFRMGGLNETILSADIDKNGVNDAGNATRVMFGDSITSATTLSGLTFRDGYADGAGDDGGGLRLSKGNANIDNCTFVYNYCNDNGAGLYLYNAAIPNISDCYFTANFADDKGGAAYTATGCDAVITNCVFENNSADTDAGAIRAYKSSPIFVNCTFVRNTLTSGDGSAADANNSISSPTFINCVFWGNLEGDTLSEDLTLTTDATATITNCAFQGTYTATGATVMGILDISDTDPLFRDTTGTAGYLNYDAGVDWSLETGSPLLGKGSAVAAPLKDVNKISRPDPPAIGAYEHSLIISTEITGTGIISPSRAYLTTGSNQAFKLVPGLGYEITAATYDAADIMSSLVDNGNGSYTYTTPTISTNGLLTATFEPLATEYTVTVTSGAGGTISPSGDTAVTVTDEIVFTITPNSDYRIEDLLLNEVSVKGSLVDNNDGTFSYTLSGVGETSTLSVSFLEIFTVTISPGTNGSISPSGSVDVIITDETEFTITASEGFILDAFTLDGADKTGDVTDNKDGTYTYVLTGVNADVTMAATFVELVTSKTYVKVGGTGDGSSWANASGDLQAAIDAGELGDEIWVAKGIYLVPAETSFTLKSGVSLYGGFAGTESAKNTRSQYRLGEANETKLSADLDGNGFLTGGNAPRVVYGEFISALTTIDGFTITGGYSDEEGSNGAGMKLRASSPKVVNCTFFDNYCDDGAALYLYRSDDKVSSPTIKNCFFFKGFANDDGGAIYNASGTRAKYINCVFSNNMANDEGGAIRNFECSPEFYNCTFVYNSLPEVDPGGKGTYGPAIRNYQTSSPYMNTEPKFVNCAFWRNLDGSDVQAYDISNTGAMESAGANAIVMNCAVDLISSSCIVTDTVYIGPVDDIHVNPGFADVSGTPGYMGYSAAADWDLVSGSILIGKGNNTEPGVPTDDMNGEPRGAVIDIGAYEFGTAIGIDQTSIKQNNVLLYPNPSAGSFTIEVKDGNITRADIYDLTGRIVKRLEDLGNMSRIPVSMSGESKGIYILELEDTEGRQSTQRIIIR